MRLATARMKTIECMPAAEFCCDEVRKEMEASGRPGTILKIDLDNTSPYFSRGHCDQELPYNNSVMIIGEDGKPLGYVPFELIDIDEGSL